MANKGWVSGGGAANASRSDNGAQGMVEGSKAASHGPMNDLMDKRSDAFESESVMGTSS
jgi:hypothetical protein